MDKETKLISLLQENDGTKRMIDECINDVIDSENIIIFGASMWGGAVLYDLLDTYRLTSKILCWSDNNDLKWGGTFKNNKLKIIAPQSLIKKYGKRPTIMIASSAYDIIKKQLMGYGYPDDHIKLYNFAFMDLRYTDKDFIYDHIEDFERAYKKMEDIKSKRIFLSILNYKITKDVKYLEMMQQDVDNEYFQYFPDGIFRYSPKECFLDVGAYTGDTFSVFNEVYEGKWEHYYGLEADERVFVKLQKKVSSLESKSHSISLYKIAAWNEKTTLFFCENAGSSTMSEKKERTENMTEADRIDNILGDSEITFVKMDIEGAEYNALMGMEEVIKKNRPILAICVYHLRDDFYKITDFIEGLMPGEYKYFMRQYRYTPTETVCYMVPHERIL